MTLSSLITLRKALLKHRMQWTMFLFLAKVAEEPSYNGKLAKELGFTSANSTGISDVLIARGLIDRVYDVEDRRKVWVGITERGKAIVDDVFWEVGKGWSEGHSRSTGAET